MRKHDDLDVRESAENMKKIGFFGGSFNPIHFGHIATAMQVTEALSLDELRVVPSFQSPQRPKIEGPSAAERLRMVELAFEKYKENQTQVHTSKVIVDPREINRGGLSYSVDSLRSLSEEFPNSSIYLVIGLDQFEIFDSWKDYREILDLAQLVVTGRPGHSFPHSLGELPPTMATLVEDFDFPQAHLTNGKWLTFFPLASEFNISSTVLRRKVRLNQDLRPWIPPQVIDYIHDHQLYQPVGPRISDDLAFTQFCASVLNDRKAIQIRGFDLSQIQTTSDFTLIASGTSTRQTSALAEALIQAVREEYSVHPQGVEGLKEGRWVIVDYGTVVVHLFYDFLRQEYRIEELWQKGNELKIKN